MNETPELDPRIKLSVNVRREVNVNLNMPNWTLHSEPGFLIFEHEEDDYSNRIVVRDEDVPILVQTLNAYLKEL